MNNRSDLTIAAWLALLLFGIYLLSFSGRLYSQDSMLMFSVTDSFVKRGEFNTDQMWTIYKARDELGPDGAAYSKTGYGASLFAVPLYALALALPDLGLVQTTLLTSAIAMALSGALVFLAARRLQYACGVSAIAALLFGLATPAWVYAKQFWSEPFSLLTLLAAFYFLLCYRDEFHARDAALAALALGLAAATRVTNAALVPFFALYGFSRAWSDRRVRRGLVWFGLVLALVALSIGWYNWVRYGNPLSTGYRADETFDNPILLGLYGLLFSPGKGLFVYVPFLAVLPWSAVIFYRRARSEFWLMCAVVVFYLVLFSTWYYWWGGTNWGPRFLVPLLPFLVLWTLPAIEQSLSRVSPSKARVAFTAIFAVLCLLSVGIELLGIGVPSLSYRLRLMRLTPNPEAASIFLPSFSPLVGYFDQLRPRVLDFAWIRAVDNTVSIDWLVIALTVAFVAVCAAGVLGALRRSRTDGTLRRADGTLRRAFPTSAVLLIAGALSLFSLYRCRDDVWFGGGEGYRALLQVVQREAQAPDALILDDDVRMPFFLNENRARLHWYGLSRDPSQWDEPTRALLTRLANQPRVWLAFDDYSASPDPTHEWLAQSMNEVIQHDLGDGVHLVLYVK
jgi:hypothetical protein